MKILFLTNIPSPYRVDFFNELGKYCNLTVLFEKGKSTERDESWNKYKFTSFNGIFLKGINIGVDKAFSLEVVKYLKKDKFDHIIVSNFSTPTGIIAIEYMRFKKINYSLESDGGFPKDNNGFKEKVKKHVIKGANLYFSTAKKHDEYYLKYGAKPENIVRYPFTSLYDRDILSKPIEKSEKNYIRSKIGIKEEKIILAVGRFIESKGFDVLIKACKDLNQNIAICIVGGEPTEEYIYLKRKFKLDNLYFIGFKKKEELQDYYKAADLFVLPTRGDVWGLVINEAMACALPVITTNKCVAGLELVEEGQNGYIVPVDNEIELGNKINFILSNHGICEEMSNKSLEKIKHYTIENLGKRHIQIFKEYLTRG